MLRLFSGFPPMRSALKSIECSSSSRSSTISKRLRNHVGTILGTCFSSQAAGDSPHSLDLESMQYLHHGKRPRFRGQPKFKSPRKRASSLLQTLKTEAIERSKKERPNVWDVPFRVGDAIEILAVAQGGVKSESVEKLRGVVLGIFRKGLDHSVLIRDVLFGESLERRIPLHSPLLRSVKVLEKNFVFKGKRKVKRAKLYYLRDRNPHLTQVTKG